MQMLNARDQLLELALGLRRIQYIIYLFNRISYFSCCIRLMSEQTLEVLRF